MKKRGVSHSIQGSWRGRYFYKTRGEAHGFEAVFVDINGRVEGNILDDGILGEALVSGHFGYPSLSFSKIYLVKNSHRQAVNYRGTMSEDGKMLSGTWYISDGLTTTGTWLAVRLDENEEIKFEEIKKTVSNDKVRRSQAGRPKTIG